MSLIWSYDFSSVPGAVGPYSGTINLVTSNTPTSGTTYTVTDISGAINGNVILGLAPVHTINFNDNTIDSSKGSSFYLAGNLAHHYVGFIVSTLGNFDIQGAGNGTVPSPYKLCLNWQTNDEFIPAANLTVSVAHSTPQHQL
jgi:hypothetical protein